MPITVVKKNADGQKVQYGTIVNGKFVPLDAVSSNKNQTVPISDPAGEDPDPSIGSPDTQAPAPFIDKIAIVLTPKSAELAHQIHAMIYTSMTGDTEFFTSAGKPLKGFRRAKLMVLPGHDERPRIDYSYQGELAGRVRIEFNPNKLGFWGLKLLHGMLLLIIPDGWRTFVTDGRITQLDVAVDLVGVRITKLMMQPPIGQSSQAWWNTGGKLLTYQWGKAKGTHTQIYNKTAEQLKKGMVLPGPQVNSCRAPLEEPLVQAADQAHRDGEPVQRHRTDHQRARGPSWGT